MSMKLSLVNRLRSVFLIIFALVAIPGCGGIEDSPDSNLNAVAISPDADEADSDFDSEEVSDIVADSNVGNIVLKGRFTDIAIEGLFYSTGTQSGLTNSAGEFTYHDGETITFSIGSLVFSTVVAADRITPIELAELANNPHVAAINITRLLLSLDDDRFVTNGIVIAPGAASNSAPINFDTSLDDFESNQFVMSMVARSGSPYTILVSASYAAELLDISVGITQAVIAHIEASYDFMNTDTVPVNMVSIDIPINVTSLKYISETGKYVQVDSKDKLTVHVSSCSGLESLYSTVKSIGIPINECTEISIPELFSENSTVSEAFTSVTFTGEEASGRINYEPDFQPGGFSIAPQRRLWSLRVNFKSDANQIRLDQPVKIVSIGTASELEPLFDIHGIGQGIPIPEGEDHEFIQAFGGTFYFADGIFCESNANCPTK